MTVELFDLIADIEGNPAVVMFDVDFNYRHIELTKAPHCYKSEFIMVVPGKRFLLEHERPICTPAMAGGVE